MALLSPASLRRSFGPAQPAAAEAAARSSRRGLLRLLSLAVEAAILAGAAAAALAAHSAIAAESLGDQASLVLIAAVVAGMLLVAALAVRHVLASGRGRLAGFALPLGLLIVCGLFVKASVIDASVEMEALVQADGTPEPPATVALGPGGRDVRLSGEITEGVSSRLAALLAAHPEVSRIALTSDGGLADEGQLVGDVIAAHGLDTFVPDFCVSACTLAFVRGHARILQEDARLGFHAPYEEGLFGAMYKGDSSDQRAAYLAAGLAPDFVDAALKVDPAGIWFPPPERLRAAGVVTASVDRYSLPDSNLDGTPDLEGARALLLRNFPLMSAFRKVSPRGVDAISGWYLDAYRHGRSEGEDTDALKAVVRGAVAVALARADDATLIDVARYLDQALADVEDPDTCAALGGHADLVGAASQAADGENGEAAATALLDAALAGRHATADIAPGSVQATHMPLEGASCADWRQAYADLLRQPAAIGAATMRAIVDAQANRSLVALHMVAGRRN